MDALFAEGEQSLLAVVLVAVGGALVLFGLVRVAWKLWRRDPEVVELPPIRLEGDGFWLRQPAIPHGAVVRYRCRVNLVPHEGEFEYIPGPVGFFVYTTGKPSDIEIIEVRPEDGEATAPPPFGGR